MQALGRQQGTPASNDGGFRLLGAKAADETAILEGEKGRAACFHILAAALRMRNRDGDVTDIGCFVKVQPIFAVPIDARDLLINTTIHGLDITAIWIIVQ